MQVCVLLCGASVSQLRYVFILIRVHLASKYLGVLRCGSILYGDACSDWRDDQGHGTHVVGSVLGCRTANPSDSSGCVLDSATGQAPGARISFIDMQSATDTDLVLIGACVYVYGGIYIVGNVGK